MMPTRALAEIADEIKKRKGRLILVGDRDQLPSIDAGGAFGSLVDRLGAARLAENRRQRTNLQRQVAGHLAEGRAAEALALLAEHGRFQAYDDGREAQRDLIDAWAHTSLQTPDRALILAHGKRDVAVLNQLARQRLDDAGMLGRQRLKAYGREWAKGDRLLCRRNDYRRDVDVRNGTRATVTKVDRVRSTVTIRTDDGRDIRLPADYLRHVDYGYASTGHASQGATVDHSYLLAAPGRGGREWGYVAGSRHRIDLHIYAVHHDPAEAQGELQRMWERSQAKTLACDRMSVAERERALGRAARRVPELTERDQPPLPVRHARSRPKRETAAERERQEREARDRVEREDRGDERSR